MTSACQQIEPLLYLHREGELSPDERGRLARHITGCDRCAAIARQLQTVDEELASERAVVSAPSPSRDLVRETMDRINERITPRRTVPIRESAHETMLSWLEPAFGLVFTALVLLFIFQQSNDAQQIASLEKQLRTETKSRQGQAMNAGQIAAQLEHANGGRLFRAPGQDGPREAGMGMPLLHQGLFDLFKRDRGAIGEIAGKYPRLASVNVEDGLDAYERSILASEGRAFLKEIEQLVRQGEQR